MCKSQNRYFSGNAFIITHWLFLNIRMKALNADLKSHRSLWCVHPSLFFQGCLARPVSVRKQVRAFLELKNSH